MLAEHVVKQRSSVKLQLDDRRSSGKRSGRMQLRKSVLFHVQTFTSRSPTTHVHASSVYMCIVQPSEYYILPSPIPPTAMMICCRPYHSVSSRVLMVIDRASKPLAERSTILRLYSTQSGSEHALTAV